MRRRAADYRRRVRRKISIWIWTFLGLFSVAGFFLIVLQYNYQDQDRVETHVLELMYLQQTQHTGTNLLQEIQKHTDNLNFSSGSYFSGTKQEISSRLPFDAGFEEFYNNDTQFLDQFRYQPVYGFKITVQVWVTKSFLCSYAKDPAFGLSTHGGTASTSIFTWKTLNKRITVMLSAKWNNHVTSIPLSHVRNRSINKLHLMKEMLL